MSVEFVGLGVPGDADRWEAVGFRSDDEGRIALANGAIVPGYEVPTLVVASAPELGEVVDGVPIVAGRIAEPVTHDVGAHELDHVVVMSDSLDRTSAEFERVLGLEQRRIRETDTVRQAFHRFPDRNGSRGCIVEIVENPKVETPALWGVVVVVSDLDRAVALGGDSIGRPKPAVQRGRRIATVRSSAGLGVAVALMST